jgi:hypothetical protein
MDGGFDISSLLSSAGSSDAISNAMSILMKKPELIETIANELGLSGNGQKEGDGGNDMATSVSSEIEKKPSERQKSGDRESLLLALKPYLSEKRQGAIDIMISLGSLSDLVSRIDPNLLKTLLGGKNV